MSDFGREDGPPSPFVSREAPPPRSEPERAEPEEVASGTAMTPPPSLADLPIAAATPPLPPRAAAPPSPPAQAAETRQVARARAPSARPRCCRACSASRATR